MWVEHLQQLALPGILVAGIGYFLGSLSFSIIFTKIFISKDIAHLAAAMQEPRMCCVRWGKGQRR